MQRKYDTLEIVRKNPKDWYVQLEVVEDDRDLGARNCQNDENKQQKPEHVVILVHPDGRHDEEQLNKTGPEGENATQQASQDRVEVPGLCGDLTRDIWGDDWELDGILFVAEVGAEENLIHV